jgi:hypothetical protein
MKHIYMNNGVVETEKQGDKYRFTVGYPSIGKRIRAAVNVILTGKIPEETLDFVQAKKIANSLTYKPYSSKKSTTPLKTHE